MCLPTTQVVDYMYVSADSSFIQFSSESKWMFMPKFPRGILVILRSPLTTKKDMHKNRTTNLRLKNNLFLPRDSCYQFKEPEPTEPQPDNNS